MPNVVVDSLVEFFTLREAAKQAARLDDAGRKRVLERAGVAKQRADAAESLWAAGHPAEALRLIVDSYARTREAAEAWLIATGERSEAATSPAVAPEGAERAPEVESAAPKAEEGAEGSETPDAKAPDEAAAITRETSDAEGAERGTETAEQKTEQKTDDAARDDAKAPAAPEPAPSSAPSDPVARFLTARRASRASIERLAAIDKELGATSLPLLDADVLPTHGDLFDRVNDLRMLVARGLADVTLVPRELLFRRIGRIATVVTLASIAIVGTYLGTRTPEGVHARASAHFNEMPDFEPSRVLDGNTETSWLLPDRTAGWVEVTINPVRAVSRIRVLNTHNVPYNDRATLQYRIQVFANGSEARVIDGAFEFSAAPAWVTHDLGAIEGVDRIRFEVRSWHQHGGGLAEIAIE